MVQPPLQGSLPLKLAQVTEFWIAPKLEISQLLWALIPAFDHPHVEQVFLIHAVGFHCCKVMPLAGVARLPGPQGPVLHTQSFSPQYKRMGLILSRFVTLCLHLLHFIMFLLVCFSSRVSVGKWHARVGWLQIYPCSKTLHTDKIVLTRADVELYQMFSSLVWTAWQYSWDPCSTCINTSGSKGEIFFRVSFFKECSRCTVKESVFQAFLPVLFCMVSQSHGLSRAHSRFTDSCGFH